MYQLQWCMLDAERRMHGFTKFQRHKKKIPGSQDYAVFLSSKKISSRKLMSVAFVDMNPFPMRQIQNRRAFHLEKVRLELTELEAIRQTFLRERETSQDRRSFVSDDDEENWPRTCRISRLSGWVARRQRNHLRRAPLFCSDERSAFPTPNRWSWSLHQSWNYQLYTF